MGSKVNHEIKRWRGRVIPYVIQDSAENLRPLIEGDAATNGAIQIIQANTHIRFVRRNSEHNYINFRNADDCSSRVGCEGGKQDINLNINRCNNVRTVLHEIAHAVGMFHEQERRDRDRFVNIHWGNIRDGEQHNFDMYSAADGSESGLYDFDSIMHYRSCAFGDSGYYWTENWTSVFSYVISGNSFLFLLKSAGFGSDGNNVHIHQINRNGTVGSRLASYRWTEGWTTAAIYSISSAFYLLLIKSVGFGSDGNNVHIHNMNGNGTVGNRIASYKWTEGWTSSLFYISGNNTYLFLLKVAGFGSDGNNVHIHLINQNGTVGNRIASYKWTEGWTIVSTYSISNISFLFLMKKAGFGSDGNNVHIHRLQVDGTVGSRLTSYKWTEGWTSAIHYDVNGSVFLLLLKSSGFGSDGSNNVHIHRMNNDGSVGNRTASYAWTEGWTTVIVYIAGNFRYLLILKAFGTGSDGNNVHLHNLGLNGTVADRLTICPTISFNTSADLSKYTGDPANMGQGSGFSNTDLVTLDSLPRGIVHIHKLGTGGLIGRRIDTQDWTNNWAVCETYQGGSELFGIFVKTVGTGNDGNNVHIHRFNSDGSIGVRIVSYKWTEGWTNIISYFISNINYLLLLKSSGFGSDGNNVHIHQLNYDGKVGSRLHSNKWTEGWNIVKIFNVSSATYLFLLKSLGFGSDGNNVHIHIINNDGSIGNRIGSHRWSEGWTSAEFYQTSSGTFLLLLKATGYGSDGNNVHIHAINPDGSIGIRVSSHRWTNGWSFVATYTTQNGNFLFLLKKSGYGSDGRNVHIHILNQDGSLGSLLETHKWTQSWHLAKFYTQVSEQYVLLLRQFYPV